MNFEIFFENYDIKNLKRLLKLDFSQAIKEAKEVRKLIFEKCPICQKDNAKLMVEIFRWGSDKSFRATHLMQRTCSPNCLKEYVARSIENNKISDKWPRFGPRKGLFNSLVFNLAINYDLKELNSLQEDEFKKALNNYLEEWPKFSLCGYCQKKNKGEWEIIFNWGKKNNFQFMDKQFCSKRCMEKFMKEKLVYNLSADKKPSNKKKVKN